MRNPNRLDEFYDELKNIHKKYFPDWRFGQLVFNFCSWYGKDIFFPEEDKMIELFKEYAKSNRRYD